MTTEPTPPATDADVVTAAGEVRAVWQAKEFSDNHHRYMIARLEYEWPTLARAIKRLTSVHTDATTCHDEYTGAGYEAGTVICERGRDHAGAHEGEGYDSERYSWTADKKPSCCGVRHPQATHDWHVCASIPGHYGDHRTTHGSSWPQDPPARCGARNTAATGMLCKRDAGHEGNHGYAGIYWPQGEVVLDVLDCGEPSAMTPTVHCKLAEGHDGDHDWQEAQDARAAARPVPARPQPCGATRPRDPKNTACTMGAWHFGMHRNHDGNVAYQWDGDGRDLPGAPSGDGRCEAMPPEGEYRLRCKLTTDHAGTHANGAHEWQDADQPPVQGSSGQTYPR